MMVLMIVVTTVITKVIAARQNNHNETMFGELRVYVKLVNQEQRVFAP